MGLPQGVASLLWNRWQLCRGMRGNFAMESVASFAWNRWQLSYGTGGNFRAEYAGHATAEAVAPRPPQSAFLYVNPGLGTLGLPLRLGVPPEITVLTLRAAG